MRLEGSPASLLRDDAQGEGTSTASTSTAIDAFGRAKYIVDSGGPRPLSPTPARSPTLALTPTLTPNLTPTLTPALTLSLSLSTGPSPSQAPRSSSSAPGTSLLLLRAPTFAALKAALLGAAGPKAPKAHHGFWKVLATPYPLLTMAYGLHSTINLHH